jgi:hypothetical protein
MTYNLNEDKIKQALIKIYNIKCQQKTFSAYLELFNTELALKKQLRLIAKCEKPSNNVLSFTAKNNPK